MTYLKRKGKRMVYMGKKEIADELIKEAGLYIEACKDTENFSFLRAKAIFFLTLAKSYLH